MSVKDEAWEALRRKNGKDWLVFKSGIQVELKYVMAERLKEARRRAEQTRKELKEKHNVET